MVKYIGINMDVFGLYKTTIFIYQVKTYIDVKYMTIRQKESNESTSLEKYKSFKE